MREKVSSTMPSAVIISCFIILVGLAGTCRGITPSDSQQLPVVNTDCGEQVTCPNSNYRPINGACVNPKHSFWGSANSPYIRFKVAKYEDGREKFRKSVKGQELPKVRLLSYTFFPDKKAPDDVHTSNVMQWGQNIAHDVTFLVGRQTSDTCCANNQMLPKGQKLPSNCYPIEIPPQDPFYPTVNVGCLNQVRASFSTAACHKNGPIIQVNGATHSIDGSFLYGNDQNKLSQLRSGTDGKLKVQKNRDGKEFLINAAPNTGIPCNNAQGETVCYDAGDIRVNQNTGITVYTIALLRLHNKLCDQLKAINPGWKDGQLFDEARRIVIAFIQHVSFKHYLPIILGYDYVQKKGLAQNNSKKDFFNPDVNPSTFLEFAGAAFRSFHSLVTGKFELSDQNFSHIKSFSIDDFYFRPAYIQNPGQLDHCLMGMAKQPQKAQDQAVTAALTNFFDKARVGQGKFGRDIESIDILRGRDLGLETYNDMRELCGLKRAKTFQDFSDVMSGDSIQKLSSVYADPEDVDLFIGGMMETLLPGTLVGPTFQCIIGEQTWHWRRGDKFYYENLGHPWSFNQAQLDSIRQTSLAWLYCTVGDDIKSIQVNPFYQPSDKNPVKPCSQIPGLNINLWKA